MSKEQLSTVWELWDAGYDTQLIADAMELPESAIYNFMYFSRKGRKVAA